MSYSSFIEGYEPREDVAFNIVTSFVDILALFSAPLGITYAFRTRAASYPFPAIIA
mgnify:CR=1 FL=1